MAKKNNREVTVLGMVNIPRRGESRIVTAPPSDDSALREAMLKAGAQPHEIMQLEQGLKRPFTSEDLAEVRKQLDRYEQRERGLYEGSGADPGSIIGLDGFTPSGETAGDGDDPRTTEPTDPS